MKIASIGYCTDQGLGRLLLDFTRAGVVTDPILYRHSHPSRHNHFEWYPRGTPIVEPGRKIYHQRQAMAVLERCDVLLAFETFFDWEVVLHCRSRRIKTVLVPMYEWTPVRWPQRPDAIVAPSLLDLDYFKPEFGERAVHLTVPVDPSRWRLRERARRFVHNSGHIGHREHKGTREFVMALPLVRSDVEIVLRSQESEALEELINNAPSIRKDPRVTIEKGGRAYEDLWDGDVLVAPEKLNGLSLPLQEAWAAGMMVMTTDRYPHNAWLPREPLIPVSRYARERIARGYLEFDEAVVRPEDVAATIDRWAGQDISSFSQKGREWAEANSWAALRDVWVKTLETI